MIDIALKGSLKKEIGSFVRLQPYMKLSLKQQGKNKLSLKYYGPYQIIKKVSSMAYGLKLLNNCLINNTFHVSNLKRLLGKKPSSSNRDIGDR